MTATYRRGTTFRLAGCGTALNLAASRIDWNAAGASGDVTAGVERVERILRTENGQWGQLMIKGAVKVTRPPGRTGTDAAGSHGPCQTGQVRPAAGDRSALSGQRPFPARSAVCAPGPAAAGGPAPPPPGVRRSPRS